MQVKCEKYWPDSGECQYGRMTVKLISESDTPDWTVRTFELSKVHICASLVYIYSKLNIPNSDRKQRSKPFVMNQGIEPMDIALD